MQKFNKKIIILNRQAYAIWHFQIVQPKTQKTRQNRQKSTQLKKHKNKINKFVKK